MTKEELEKEAEESWWNDNNCSGALSTKKIYICGYLAGAEPREKRIAELEKENAELKAYNEKLLDGDIEKHNKIVELQRENKELKERNKVIDEELLIKQKQLTNAISCLYKSLEVLTKLTEGMRHIAYNHPTMHAHREIMQNLRLAEDYEVELGNILSQGNFGRDEIEVELGKNERRI